MSAERRSRSWLIAALSGRGLAKAATRAGLPTRGIDGYADLDTQAYSRAWARAPQTADYSLDPNTLLDQAAALCPPTRCHGLVYGAGFESRPELLAQLAEGRRLFGNSPEVLAQTGNPTRFFPLLKRLGIPHPEVRYTRPRRALGWLSKQAGACGGTHIQPVLPNTDGAGRYFQRQVQGQSCSLLFLANGHTIFPVGFNRPLPPPPEAPGPWAYSGAARLGGETSRDFAALLDAARALTSALGLKGLNGIDVMIDQRDWKLLELNPRPTATMELWDVAPMPSLFDLHVQACQGVLPTSLPNLQGCLASAVVYAGETLQIPSDFVWPDWCSDLPAAGSVISPGEPVCTVLAAGDSVTVAEYWAGEFRRSILRRLSSFQARDFSLSNTTEEPAWA